MVRSWESWRTPLGELMGLGPLLTFIRKKVMLVRRSTVDLRSWSLSGLLAGKLFCWKRGERLDYKEGWVRGDSVLGEI